MFEGANQSDRILMNNFRAEPPELIQEEIEACQRVIRSGWFILGKEVETFEAAWSASCGAPYAVGTGNGMDAIEIGLRLVDIGPGDEVITTAMTAYATVLAILRAGATPVMADISTEEPLLDLASVERCLSARTKAVLLVHLYGQVADMTRWSEFCARHQLHLLEDCAQAHGARWLGQSAGMFGEWGAYSFYPTKNLGAIGDAGALILKSPDQALRARRLRNYGQSDRYHHEERGLNSRLDELQAALLSARLPWLSSFIDRRREIASCYHKNITGTQVELPKAPPFAENHVYHLYVIRCSRRKELMQHLANAGIESQVHYPVPCHLQPAVRDLPIDRNGLPNTESHATSCLSIPCHPQMSNAEIGRIIEAVNSFV